MSDVHGQLKPTQLREYYDALSALKEQELTALAELHAEDPERLIERFRLSVNTAAGYQPIAEPFHDQRSEAWMEKAGGTIKSTTAFVANLAAGGSHEVIDAPELNFDFLDREIFPLRSRKVGLADRSARRSIDLLLKDCEGYPIVGELKVAGDKPTYYALVQALMYAAELSSKSQLVRLGEQYDLRIPEGPFLAIYLVGYEAPQKGRFRERSFDASQTIASKLMLDPRVNGVVKRIAYLEAESNHHDLIFRSRFNLSGDQ